MNTSKKAVALSLTTLGFGCLLSTALWAAVTQPEEVTTYTPFFKISETVIQQVLDETNPRTGGNSPRRQTGGGTQTGGTGVVKHNSSPIGGYSPQQIKHAYHIDQIQAQGEGQTIVCVDAYGNPTMQNDLNTFSAQYGLPQSSFRIINAPASSASAPTSGNTADSAKKNADIQGWMVETSLDVEWAHAIAPQANLILVVAASDSNQDLTAAIKVAIQQNPNVISMSFGGPEPKTVKSLSSNDTLFKTSGITFVASSGDSGAGVNFPASSPYVLAVGGTTLTLDASGNRTSDETAWSGSGGGISAVEPMPSFQANAVNGSGRGVPDVAYDADPKTGFAIYFTNSFTVTDGAKSGTVSGWFQVGGTSAGSPQWSGLIADLNSTRAAAGEFTSDIYQIAKGSEYHSAFTDITSGSDGSDPQDSATIGWDQVTGWGSPLADGLVSGMSSL